MSKTNEEMIDHIEHKIINGITTMREIADAADVSYQYVKDTLTARRSVSDKLARSQGFRRVVRFEPDTATPGHEERIKAIAAAALLVRGYERDLEGETDPILIHMRETGKTDALEELASACDAVIGTKEAPE